MTFDDFRSNKNMEDSESIRNDWGNWYLQRSDPRTYEKGTDVVSRSRSNAMSPKQLKEKSPNSLSPKNSAADKKKRISQFFLKQTLTTRLITNKHTLCTKVDSSLIEIIITQHNGLRIDVMEYSTSTKISLQQVLYMRQLQI
ncbi:ribose 1,5-bis phosphate isomerase [Acrasis kona]|uniref:Ribose 1,5-bis phosphate isomerase n=1 Tax=Acrasis kona TaxID=1008807 RepID=A0AAW2ZFW5_9EUKA